MSKSVVSPQREALIHSKWKECRSCWPRGSIYMSVPVFTGSGIALMWDRSLALGGPGSDDVIVYRLYVAGVDYGVVSEGVVVETGNSSDLGGLLDQGPHGKESKMSTNATSKNGAAGNDADLRKWALETALNVYSGQSPEMQMQQARAFYAFLRGDS